MLELSKQAQSLKLGKYKHFKGGMYEVFGVACHSETLEELVVYSNFETGELWVRSLEDFLQQIEVSGKSIARFECQE